MFTWGSEFDQQGPYSCWRGPSLERESSDCRRNRAPPALMLGSLAEIPVPHVVQRGYAFQKVCCDLLPPQHATHTRAFAGVFFATRKLPSLLEEFADFSAAYSDCADPVLLTLVSLFLSG